jgi:hypothetical protein
VKKVDITEETFLLLFKRGFVKNITCELNKKGIRFFKKILKDMK